MSTLVTPATLGAVAHSHFQPLMTAIPGWLGNASAPRRQQLRRATAKLAERLNTTPAATHATQNSLNAAHWSAHNQVEEALKAVKDARHFAEPLLKQALSSQFGLDLDVRQTFLRLYVPQTIPWFPVPSGGARTWTVSLLDAALHNFEQKETLDDAYEAASTYITQPSATGRFDTLPAIKPVMSITAFTRLCRELDIGKQYATYLRQQLALDEPVAAAVLKLKVQRSQMAAFRAALHFARMSGDIQEDYWRLLDGMADGVQGLRMNRQPVLCHELIMMGARLTGILVFAPDLEQARSTVRVVAYVPDDPEHPIKEYPSTQAMQAELVRQLRSSDYQGFFSRFVAHAQLGSFFADLGQRLSRITWHQPQPGSDLPTWRQTPTAAPNLQTVALKISGDPWLHLFQRTLDRVINDGRSMAIATATVDQQARWARWDAFVRVASSILQTAALIIAPFIPFAGELMMGYMAYQLLNDVFEGVVDWAEGLGREAFEHLMSTVEAMVQLGAFAVGSTLGVAALLKVLPPETIAFFERLKPVTLKNSKTRYWPPDLTPYARDAALAKGAKPDPSGLLRVRHETLLPLDDRLYAIDPSSTPATIKHPTRPDAYQPELRHNGMGAWHTELEQPLQWDKQTLLRRIGHTVGDLSAADQALALKISGLHEDALRKMHVNREPTPPLLAETLARLRIDRQVQTLIEHLRSDDPTVQRAIDPQDQIQLLTSSGLWPKSRALQFFDAQGQVAWTFGDKALPAVPVTEAQLNRGDLLKTVLQTLTPEESRSAFGATVGDPKLNMSVRLKQLRTRLADIADKQRTLLFDSRLPSSPTPSPRIQRLVAAVPDLPASLAEHVLSQATGDELKALDNHQTPARLLDFARTAHKEWRATRAYEGQYLAAGDHLDTHRLALHSLPRLPGWTGRVRLEIKPPTPTATRLDAIGKPDAPVSRTLVRTSPHRYTPHDERGALFGETDLHTAILQALPDTERDALGIRIGQGPQLKQALADHALERKQLHALLDPHPARNTPDTRTHERLLGMHRYRPAAVPEGPPSFEAQAQELFPGHNAAQVNEWVNALEALPGGAQPMLTALKQQYQQLEHDLAQWAASVPQIHPGNGLRLSPAELEYARQNRRLWHHELRRCWRQETELDDYFEPPTPNGQILRLPVMFGELPRLQASFEQISLLELRGDHTPMDVEPFLRLFPRLRHLAIRNVRLGTVPATLSTLPNLNELVLSQCNIALTDESATALAALSRLRTLDLYNNPLGRAPSVESMAELSYLDLCGTGINQLPAGLLSRSQLRTALLFDNELTELPASLFALATDSPRDFNFSGNPFPDATLEQVKSHFQRTGRYWGIDPPRIDVEQVKELFPKFTPDEINRLIFALPGNLEAGRLQLSDLKQQYQTLSHELDAWISTAGAPAERGRREAFKATLQSCWRRESEPDDTSFTAAPGLRLTAAQPLGDAFPPVPVPFRHVSSMYLEGNAASFPLYPQPFFRGFPALSRLSINNYAVGDIPGTLLGLPQLSSLSLTRCTLTLSTDTTASLASMADLRHLDLSHNPLEYVPDFSRMPGLDSLNLESTGLTQVPDGLLAALQRTQVNLRHNQITHLPDQLFALPTAVTGAFDLARNPLSVEALAKIKAYCQRTGEHLKADAPSPSRDAIKALYPTFTSTEASRFFFELAGDLDAVAPEIERLQLEYAQLGTDLQQWVLNVPARHPVLDTLLDEQTRALEQQNRLSFKAQLEAAWRHETSLDETSGSSELTHQLVIDTPLLGDLPPLNARFDHISELELNGEDCTTNIDGLLRCFPRLVSLTVYRYRLVDIPPAVFNMPRLAILNLAECAIRLTSESAEALAALHGLEYLDLGSNPLGISPDVSQMSNLDGLRLEDTGISEIPRGVFSLPNLSNLDISDNQISELPPEIVDAAPRLSGSDLSGNPWSEESLDYLRQCYTRTGDNLSVEEAMTDAGGTRLDVPPQFDPAEN